MIIIIVTLFNESFLSAKISLFIKKNTDIFLSMGQISVAKQGRSRQVAVLRH